MMTLRTVFNFLTFLTGRNKLVKPAVRHIARFIAHAYQLSFLDESFEEWYLVCMSVVQYRCLSSHQSSFMEHCYGLRRRNLGVAEGIDQSRESMELYLSSFQKLCSVAYITMVPYFIKTLKDYAASTYLASDRISARQSIRASAMGPHHSMSSTNGSHLTTFTRYLSSFAERMTSWMRYLLNRSLPYAELALDLSRVAYQFLYLTKQSQYHDTIFALLHMRLEKSGRSSVVDVDASGGDSTTSVPAGRGISSMHIIMAIIISLRVTEYVHNYTQSPEHQSQSLSARLAEPVKLPSVPARPPSAQGCLNPPRDHSLCVLCNERRRDPCACSSGYVFCYLCILQYVREHGRCPITAMPCKEEEIIKLYVGARHGDDDSELSPI